MFLGFTARGHGLAGSSVRIKATLLALVADLVWYVLVKF
jgi:hypothetical protein